MSYCRWSSDDYRSDVYAYDTDDGVAVHIASHRVIFPDDMPAQPDLLAHAPEEWVRLHRQWQARFEQCPTEPIGLPHDGHHFYGLGYGQAADLLARIVEMGYHVPAGVIDTLREEESQAVGAGR